jgi:hypothetical protein
MTEVPQAMASIGNLCYIFVSVCYGTENDFFAVPLNVMPCSVGHSLASVKSASQDIVPNLNAVTEFSLNEYGNFGFILYVAVL